jgi:glycosyltransferase involved in cell wall biosynthesis
VKILFVHEVSYEKKPIFEIQEFPEHLAARGHNVTFLQFDEGYKFWSGQGQPLEKTIPGRVVPNTSIKLVTPQQFGIPGLDRLYATVSIWPVLDSLLKAQTFDAIVLYAVPTYGHQVIRLAKKYKVPVIFRALDVSHLIRKSFLSPLIKSVEKYVYKHSDFLSANNPAMARYCSKFGDRMINTFINLPPMDVSHFKNKGNQGVVALNQLRESLGINPADKVITYMGSFFYFSGLDTVIRDFANNPLPGIKLLLIGGGEQDHELRKLVEHANLQDRVIFTGFVPYGKLPDYLQLSTVAINPMLPRIVSNTAFPHKVLQYIAAGIPVVSTKLDGLFETFGPQSGVTWAEGPAQVIGQAIALLADADRREAAVNEQTTTATRLLDVDRAVDDFENVIHNAGVSAK